LLQPWRFFAESEREPESPLTIENGVVTACDKRVRHVVVPEGVTQLGENWNLDSCVFSNCWRLVDITLPASLKKIATGSFENCTALTWNTGLTEIYFYGTKEQWLAVEKPDYAADPLMADVFPAVVVHCTDGDAAREGNLISRDGAGGVVQFRVK